MQSTRLRQQVTTCPQCDNIVSIYAEFCNICGQQLQPTSGIYAQQGNLTTPLFEDDIEDDNRDEERLLSDATQTRALSSTPAELLSTLRRLQEQSTHIDLFFPADLPDKEKKLLAWKKQIQRAQVCAELFERPQLQHIDSQQILKLRHYLAEATHALDFTREYSVKLIGHAGAGKSTLLATLIGRDIFPRLAGGAVTGVRTQVRLCHESEPEEMHVHFLSQSAFEEMLKHTQQSIQNAPNQRMRDALAQELTILLKASEVFSEQYLREDEPYIEVIPQERWKNESSHYIEEPARDDPEPRLIRLIEYVEYRVHAGPYSILPTGSILVDLPGGSAGQVHHDSMLRDALNTVDAVIFVIGNNRFGDDERTERIFEIARRKIVQGRAPEVAARMTFLAVTHWDEVNSQASMEKAIGSLRPLLRDLPANYSSYHHHGPTNSHFFYPIRGLDALLATLGLTRQKLDADRMQEGRDYAGRILSVYPELLQIDPTLPVSAQAQEFQKVSPKQHEAMLHFSGLLELTQDLQTFLASNRYDVQLRQAETQLAMALQQLEDLCWEHLNNVGVSSRDLQELQQEMQARKSKRGATRFEQLQQRTNEMHVAWKDALKHFDTVIRTENNPFHQALVKAHERASRRINIRIMQGHFDSAIKVSNSTQSDSPAMEIGNRWVDIDGWGLIKDLRLSFSAALERELNEPARTLAEAFLIPIAHKEEIDGTLDINRVALGEFGGELDDIHKSYNKLKRIIREKARDICLYVTMGELLNEEKYAPTKDDPAVNALYRLTLSQGDAEDIIQQARQLMGPILDVICGGLAQSTEQRIAHLFRYDLDKLEQRQVYDGDRLDIMPSSMPGIFADLINRLYSLLTERVLVSDKLRQQLDTLQAFREADVDRWVEILQNTEQLRTLHRQE